MTLMVLDGGGGDLPMPDWSAVFVNETQQQRATEVWRLTITEMRDAATLAPVNSNQVKRYVIACVMFDEATAKVAEQGPVVPAKRTKSASWNPWWTVLKDADTMASGHEDKLGLNPRRRGAVTAAKKKSKRATAADGYLGRAQG